MRHVYLLLVWVLELLGGGAGGEECGGVLSSEAGLITTPGFPGPFPVPLHCRWILDSSAQPEDTNIVVYLTQLFVTTGLTLTEFAYYETDSPFQLDAKLLYSVSESNVISVLNVTTLQRYLVIDFRMDRLEGNHLRALDGLLDVYGFNITYAIRRPTVNFRPKSCSVSNCSMNGQCYVGRDYSSFWCLCFEGFTGPDCSEGSLCRNETNPCRNGATCRHVGAADVSCICPPGFTGSLCDKPLPLKDCAVEDDCLTQCKYDSSREGTCNCDKGGMRVTQDLSHYECTLRLMNLSALRESPRPMEVRIQKQITRYLRGSNLAKVEEAKILNITVGGEVRFHFLGGRREGGRVREVLSSLVEKGKLGNLTLIPTHFAFKQEPTLLLRSVAVNHKDGLVRQGDGFVLSCLAQGSTHISFRWYKDGAPVNATKATRKISTTVAPQDTSDKITGYLRVEQADPLDGGEYRCQVVDWGIQQCKSVSVYVVQPLQVSVLPMSSTLEKGSNLTIRCSTRNKHMNTKYGYNWTKNKSLFPMNTKKEFWEDLYPDGSILKIYNIQKSATYTCQVQGGVWAGEGSGTVEVAGGGGGCGGGKDGGGTSWPPSPPGLQATTPCPSTYLGTATRLCLLLEPGKARWQVPDYSSCVSRTTANIISNFRSLTLGYETTTVSRTVFEIASSLQGRSGVYPGEGEPLVTLLSSVLVYLNVTGNWLELVNTSANFFAAVNALLQKNSSIINQQKVALLQKTVEDWALIWGKYSAGTYNHLVYDAIFVNTVKVLPLQKSLKISIPNERYSYPGWFKNGMTVEIENSVAESLNFSHQALAIVVYRDLKKFLFKQYSQKMQDGSELEFEVVSGVCGVGVSGGLGVVTRLEMGWEGTACAVALPGQEWRPSGCNSSSSHSGLYCSCSQPGLYAAIKDHNPPNKRPDIGSRSSAVVLVGCCCCLVQSLLTLILLLIRWWHRATCILFLKLQCCTTTAATMAVFIYATQTAVPETMYFYVSVSLQLFILMTLSSQLAKLVIVYSEVVKMPKVKHFRSTVVTIITGICGVCGLCSAVVQGYRVGEEGTWWMRLGSPMFNITASYATLVLLLYIFIGSDLTFKLATILNKKIPAANETILRRTGLMKRSLAVLLSTVLMTTSSVLYATNPGLGYQCVFSLASIAMGLTIFLCYIILSETSRRGPGFLGKSKILGLEEAYSSESDNSFFTKQEAEAECEGVPPRRSEEGTLSCPEEILLKPLTVPRKSVTFHSDLVTGCSVIEDSSSGSPEKEDCLGEGKREEERGGFPRASYLQNPPSDPAQGCLQEILTTRVCLEVGLLNPPDHRPPLMLCNVDIEPSTTRVMELPERLDNKEAEGQDNGNYLEESEGGGPRESDVLHRISHDLQYLLNNNLNDNYAADEVKTSL